MTKANKPSDTNPPGDNLASGSAAALAANQTLPKSARTVTVACKLPHGIVIRDFEERSEYEPVFGQTARRKVSVYRPIGPNIRIKGPVVPSLFIRHIEIVGEYAITEGIPADVFERWAEHNKDSQAVVNKLIFAHEDGARVRAWAKDHESVKSGMEPLSTAMKKTDDGRQVFKDERISRAGADGVIDGKVDAAA